jgi:signal transduction histidine kinase
MSIRARLTISFTVLFGAIVIALAIAGYVFAKQDAYLRLDAALQVATGATAMSAEHELNEHPTKFGGERDLQLVLDGTANRALSDTQILVREGSRNAVYKPGTTRDFDLRNISSSALRNEATLDRYRIATRILRVQKLNTSYEIYAAKPVSALSARLLRIRLGLIAFVPIGLALAGLAGYLLATRSLRPLQQLSATVDAVSSSDLSARVRVANEQDEIGSLGLRFNALLDRLEQAFTVQRQFMADASHQVRTPVTVALAAAQVTARDSNATVLDCKDSLQVIERQMLLLRRTVEDMFFLSQTDTGSLRFERKPVYLDDAVGDAVRAANALAKPRGQSLQVRPLPEARCLGDLDLLKQAVFILLDNAVKFTPLRGRIEVALFKRETQWICSVTDEGVGISTSAQSLIFERFFRENRPGNEAVSGSGLGLAIAKSIVDNHGGSVTLVESRPGRTTFEIAIPTFEDEISDSVQANSLAVKM